MEQPESEHGPESGRPKDPTAGRGKHGGEVRAPLFICALGSCYHRGQPRWDTWSGLLDHLLNIHRFKREGERMVRR